MEKKVGTQRRQCNVKVCKIDLLSQTQMDNDKKFSYQKWALKGWCVNRDTNVTFSSKAFCQSRNIIM